MATAIHDKPYPVSDESWDQCMRLFPKWLRERGGIAVYECHVMDSSQMGTMAFMPVRYQAQDESWQWAPDRIGDVPSRFKERVDTITVEAFGGDIDRCLAACFKRMPPDQPPVVSKSRRRR